MDFRVRLAAVVLAATIAGCGGFANQDTQTATIRVGVLPDQERADLQRRHAPLVDYLGSVTGLDLELRFHDTYHDFSDAFENGTIDIAWFGGLTFVRAEHSSNAEPLVMREIDNRFVSYFIVRANADGHSVGDFESGRLAFGPQLSTSGHLMPLHFLRQRGIDPELFFASVRNSSGHDQTARWVRDGEADLGVVNSAILEAMVADGRLNADDVRVLEVTPTYANYVWGVQQDMSQETKLKLRNAFLALDPADPVHAHILGLQAATGYMPAMKADFRIPRAAAQQAGLLSPSS